jgi:hypothetical protein
MVQGWSQSEWGRAEVSILGRIERGERSKWRIHKAFSLISAIPHVALMPLTARPFRPWLQREGARP